VYSVALQALEGIKSLEKSCFYGSSLICTSPPPYASHFLLVTTLSIILKLKSISIILPIPKSKSAIRTSPAEKYAYTGTVVVGEVLAIIEGLKPALDVDVVAKLSVHVASRKKKTWVGNVGTVPS